MNQATFIRSVAVCVAALSWGQTARAQLFDFFGGGNSATTEVQLKPEEVRSYLEKTADDYSIEVDGVQATRIDEPLMQWQNTTRLSEEGLFYAWTIDRRPVALICVFTFELEAIRAKHELLCLQPGGLTAKIDGQVVWTPDESLAKFTEVPGADPPAASPARRKLQWTQIARRFTGSHVHPEGEVTTLRRMSRPIYAYASPKHKVIDGVILPMVISTDPEIFLMLEARQTDAGPKWFYAAVPSHYHELRLSLDDQVVWTKPLRMEFQNARQGQSVAKSSAYSSFSPTRELQ